MRDKFRIAFTLIFLGVSLAGCGRNEQSTATLKKNLIDLSKATITYADKDLADVGKAYQNFNEKEKRGPIHLEEFRSFVEAINERALDSLRNGTYVFIYNVGIMDLKPPGDFVLAYHKVTPETGGPVLMGDGLIKHMKPGDFKTAKKAQPKN